MKNKIIQVLTLSILVSGCELLGPKQHEKRVLRPADQLLEVKENDVVFDELSNDPDKDKTLEAQKSQVYPGSGRYVDARSTLKKIPKADRYVTAKGPFGFNFDDADLGEVVDTILGQTLNVNYVLSPKVAGKVTMRTTQALTLDELLPTLEMVLAGNNAALVYQDGIYYIKPQAEVIGHTAFSSYSGYRQKFPNGAQIRVAPVKNVAVDELLEIIKPLMQERTIVNTDSKRNLMMIVGVPSELRRALDIIATFDVDVMKGRSFGLFPMKHVEAKLIIEELDKVFQQDGGDKGFIQFIEIERLNAILAITFQPAHLRKVENWIMRLDKADSYAGGGVMVYRAQHVDAVELAETLNKIFSQSNRSGSRPASIASGRNSVTISNKKQPKNTKTSTRNINNKNASIVDVGDVNIIADEVNNALIVVATAQDYAIVESVIKKLDVMPLQVLIDATIVEVTLKDELEYGIRWFLSHQNGGQHGASSGGFDLTKNAADMAVGAATGGLGYAFVSNSEDIKAVLDATATDNNANVISAPSLMVLNNQEASIQVGKEVPVLSSESTNTSGGDNNVVTNTIQMRETGITLKVTPRVNANGLVIMDIDQKADDVLDQEIGGIRSPSFQQRQITSTVAVHSGETIVLGGLIDENDTYNKSGVPFLHKIPLIGSLFGSTIKKNNKTELVVLITPRVVKSRLDARLITNEFQRKLSGIYREPEQHEIEIQQGVFSEANPVELELEK